MELNPFKCVKLKHKQTQRQNNVSVCTVHLIEYAGVHGSTWEWTAVSASKNLKSKYFEQCFACLWLKSVYMFICAHVRVRVRHWGHEKRIPEIWRCIICWSYTYSSPWGHTNNRARQTYVTVPQVNVCVISRGITLWWDHTGDSFQLGKHHIKHTLARARTHTHTQNWIQFACFPSCVIEKSCCPLKLADIT